MNRLWVKLTLAFLLIALVAVGVVAVLSATTTGNEFRQYVVRNNMAARPALIEELTDYHVTHGGWEGVDALLTEADRAGSGPGRGRRMGGPHLAIAGDQGLIVADAGGQLAGQRVSSDVVAQGIPLTVDGRQVGTLLVLGGPGEAQLDAQAQFFLQQVRSSLTWAGLLATLLALLLGLFVSRRLTAPLRRLTDAATAIAGGNLEQKVAVKSNDEIGELGKAFDGMAASLQQAESLRRNMMADIAHELRTPLTVIQGNLQAIMEGVYPLDQDQVASLYDETRLLTRLVEDLRDLALAEAGQLKLEHAPLELVGLARTTLANFTPAAEAAGIRLALEAATPSVEVLGDADRLRQVLRNLLSNALRHTPQGGQITISVSRMDGRAALQVSDTGTGIPPEDLPHVFDRFYRGDRSRSRRGGGSGLGLAIARQLVVAHGGEIEVKSQAGQGAAFTVLLPTWRRHLMTKSSG